MRQLRKAKEVPVDAPASKRIIIAVANVQALRFWRIPYQQNRERYYVPGLRSCGFMLHRAPSGCIVQSAADSMLPQLMRVRYAKRDDKRAHRVCQQCGKPFTIMPSAFNRPGYNMGKFCSCECRRAKTPDSAVMPIPKVPYVQLTCQWCGKTYEVTGHRSPKTRSFVARHCQGAWAARNMNRKKHALKQRFGHCLTKWACRISKSAQ